MPPAPTGAQMAAELVNVLRQTSAAPEQDQLADMSRRDPQAGAHPGGLAFEVAGTAVLRFSAAPDRSCTEQKP